MRTRKRLEGLKAWITKELCAGRLMKAPAPDMDITEFVRQEPHCYLAWQPAHPNENGYMETDPISVCPGILVMPNASKVKDMPEERFDRYNNVHRPQELGQTLSVSILFSVYEPGIRLPGFVGDEETGGDEVLDMSKLMEGTEQGLFTLMDWMDDCSEKMLAEKFIPGTDLFVNEASMAYSLYTDQSFVVDKRPIFYGFINVVFGCYANEKPNASIDEFLK